MFGPHCSFEQIVMTARLRVAATGVSKLRQPNELVQAEVPHQIHVRRSRSWIPARQPIWARRSASKRIQSK